jgi:hypothetical protein
MLEIRGTREGDFNFLTRQLEESEKKYLSADEVQLLAPYSLADADKYHFEWTPGPIYNRYLPERMECYKKYADAAARYNAKKENKK